MKEKPEDALRAYVRAFETLDPDAIARFYHRPCMFIAPPGASLASDSDAARAVAARLVEHARSEGYRRTEVLNLKVKRLADSLASLTGVFVRYSAADEEISRFGFGYTLWHDGTSWRIVVAMAHDAAATQP